MKNKKIKNKIAGNVSNVGKMAAGFCAGAVVVGIASIIKANSMNKLIQDQREDIEDLYNHKLKSDDVLDILSDKVKSLQHEVDIRDCMVMEGIDGDPEIYSRRMQHFRDYKIQTSDIGQKQEDSEDYCHESALDAEAAYLNYIKSLNKFKSEVPVITEDDELPF